MTKQEFLAVARATAGSRISWWFERRAAAVAEHDARASGLFRDLADSYRALEEYFRSRTEG